MGSKKFNRWLLSGLLVAGLATVVTVRAADDKKTDAKEGNEVN
jgi:hypothetical protein